MTAPHDPASDVINAFVTAMKAAFNPNDTVLPPLGGGSTHVRFFAGDGALPAWDPESSRERMFLWVRAANRYRSRGRDFPSATLQLGRCDNPEVFRVLAVEVGVARCTSMEDGCDWEQLATEAEISLDDSWRIEEALCMAANALKKTDRDRAVATDTVAPIGPEGGVIAWTGMAYAQFGGDD